MSRPPRSRPGRAPGRAARRGTVLPLVAVLVVACTAVLAFVVDLGYIALVRDRLQNAADSAALAAAARLPDRGRLAGDPDPAAVERLARAEAALFAGLHDAGGLRPALGESDVEFGRLARPRDPGSAFSPGAGPYNAVRVTVRRTAAGNGPLDLFFAPLLGRDAASVEAAAVAVLEGDVRGFRADPRYPDVRPLVLPFAADVEDWRATAAGHGRDDWSYDPDTGAYRRGRDGISELRLYPDGTAAGNLGTVDIGNGSNSVGDIQRQILRGPSAADLEPTGGSLELGDDGTLPLSGDPGLSAGFEPQLKAIRGQLRAIPLYRGPVAGGGNGAVYTIVGFGGCAVLDVDLSGPDKRLVVQPEYVTDPTGFGGGPPQTESFVVLPLQLAR